jgi:hypothetical protein
MHFFDRQYLFGYQPLPRKAAVIAAKVFYEKA